MIDKNKTHCYLLRVLLILNLALIPFASLRHTILR